MVRGHERIVSPAVLCEIFCLNEGGRIAILLGADWHPDYSTEGNVRSMKDLFGDTPFQLPAPNPAVRNTDPETSYVAAKAHRVLRNTDRWSALVIHSRHPDGLTDFELAEKLGRQQTSAGKRRGELRDLGFIKPTEERRSAPSGSPAIVWRITNEGCRVAAERKA